MILLFQFFALWRALPVVLRYFKLIPAETRRVDDQGNAWSDNGPNVGTEPTYVVLRPTSSEAGFAGAGVAWSLWSLLS